MGAVVIETLRFGVLGPLEVLRNGEPVRLAGERQRALLALLLLRAHELAATEMLVDQLFGEERPDGAVQALRMAVSRLRRLLDDGQGGEVLVTRPGGYVLAPKPGALDVEEFESLLAEGRRLLSAGDPESAAARLRAGLALWRGAPFADVAYLEFGQAEIRRLEGLRLSAVVERVDADLALGRDAELIVELEGLVASNPLHERLRCQLMTALYRAGRPTDALAVYRHASEMLRDELGLAPGRALRELEQAILSQDASLERSDRDGARAQPVVCPFKGLAPFDRADACYFCGRERVVSDVIARLAASPLVGVVGPSGIGKSSLLRAGVLASLGEGALPGSAGWRQVLVRPGGHPLAELTRALDCDRLTQTFSWLGPDQRVVLAIDQLEEVFTVCSDEEERTEFLSAVAALADDPSGRARVVIALRGDFYGRVASYPRFAELLSRSHVLVGPMEREELARAIKTPAARAGLEVEPTLVDSLVRDVAGEPGGLPLLSTALLELWRERDGRELRSEQYRSNGGVRGAVARIAEAAYASLPEADRPVARALMLRLASGDPDSLVRRRVPIGELERTDPTGRVLAALTDARLLTTSDGEVEVSHEALIREWPRYRGWLEEDRVGRRVHEHLKTSASEWKLRGSETADLYRGARLAAGLEWAGQHADEPTSLERQFLTASQRQTEREARRLRAILAGVGILLAVSIVAGIVALSQQRAARIEARVALSREVAAEAVAEPRIDVAMLLAREAVNLDRSAQTESTLMATLLRAPAAIGASAPAVPVASPVGEIIYSPRRGTEAATLPDQVTGSAISPSGSALYSSPSNGVLLKWDLSDARGFPSRFAAGSASPPPPGDGVSPPAPPLTVSPDGSRFAVRLGPSTVGLFSSSTLRPITSFTVSPPGNGITALAWSPSGDLLAVGGHVGLVQLWSTKHSPRLVRKLVALDSRFGEPEAIQAIAFSSDGRLVAASDDNDAGLSSADPSYTTDYAHVAIWQTSTGRLLASPSALTDQTQTGATPLNPDDAIAFSPDRKLLAMSLFNGKIIIFDSSTGHVMRAWDSNSGATSLAFAPDGTLAIGTRDGTIEFRNVATGRQIGSPLVAAAAAVTSVAFDRTGQRFTTAGFGEGTVKLWFTGSHQGQGLALDTDPGSTASATFEPDGDRLLAVDDNGHGFAWPTSLASWERQACRVAGRNLSRQEWSQLIVGQPYETVCP